MQLNSVLKYPFCGYFIALFFLVTSCQKEEIIPIQEDYRNQLEGVYIGAMEQTSLVHSTETNQTEKSQEILPNHEIVITKLDDQTNGIAINGMALTASMDMTNKPNEYSDVFIYSALDCDGMESYKVLFYPASKQIVIDFKHSKNCLLEKLEQNYHFSGTKSNQ